MRAYFQSNSIEKLKVVLSKIKTGNRFRSPAGREATMRQQPFVHNGTMVTLLRGWETVVLDSYLIHNMPQHLVRSPNDITYENKRRHTQRTCHVVIAPVMHK
jgi:hypothetical protein